MDAFLTQKEYFRSGATLPLEFRLAQLRSLYRGIKRFEPQILKALRSDLGKSAEESYMSEIGMCLTEIRHTARHLREWSRPQRVPTPLMHFPGQQPDCPGARASASSSLPGTIPSCWQWGR